MTTALLVIVAVLGVLFSILVNVVASEVYEWLPALAVRIVRLAASRLPRSSDRYREEWTAHLDEIPGHGAKFVSAVWLLVRLPRLRRALPKTEIRSAVFIAAGSSTVSGVSKTPAPPAVDVVLAPSTGALGLIGGTPRVVIGGTFEGWETSTTSPSAHPSIHLHHHEMRRRHPAYGMTVSNAILPLDGSTRDRSS